MGPLRLPCPHAAASLTAALAQGRAYSATSQIVLFFSTVRGDSTMKYVQWSATSDSWLDLIATAKAIVLAQQCTGEKPEVIWAEAYAELVIASCWRFRKQRLADPSGFAAHVDAAICGSVRFAAVREGLRLPDDWHAPGRGGDQLRAEVWGQAANMRTHQLDENAASFAELSEEEIKAMLNRMANHCRAIGRRAAFKIITNNDAS